MSDKSPDAARPDTEAEKMLTEIREAWEQFSESSEAPHPDEAGDNFLRLAELLQDTPSRGLSPAGASTPAPCNCPKNGHGHASWCKYSGIYNGNEPIGTAPQPSAPPTDGEKWSFAASATIDAKPAQLAKHEWPAGQPSAPPTLCGVCLGQPLKSGKACICKGIGTEQAEMQGLREYVLELEEQLARAGQPSAAVEYADRVLRFAVTIPCLSSLLDEDTDDDCECYGCAGRKYVALATAAASDSLPEERNDG